jgi:hypothetical protein
MVNQQPYRAIWSLALALALAGILVAACGNRPTPEQITAIPTDTPAPPTNPNPPPNRNTDSRRSAHRYCL